GCCAAVAGEALLAVARNGGDRRAADLADAMVVRVGDVKIAVWIDGQSCGVAQLRRGSDAAIPGEARSACTGNGRNRPVTHLADALIVRVGNVDISRGIDRNARG